MWVRRFKHFSGRGGIILFGGLVAQVHIHKCNSPQGTSKESSHGNGEDHVQSSVAREIGMNAPQHYATAK
ncbi:hypothetical protein JCM12294_23810 [Desulfocicer niacini]